jgi:hypothetical protein
VDSVAQKGDNMEDIKFGLELAVGFLLMIMALFIAYYKISEKVLNKKLRAGKN